jgi:diguanylate cyclase (GGDEF)-like protein
MFRSFRSRLTLFFVAIVIVPMVVVTVALFRLISDNERGKADARVAQAQTGAIGLYRRATETAGTAAGRVGRDPIFVAALRAHDGPAATRRAAQLLADQRARRIVVSDGSRPVVDVGTHDAIAPSTRDLVGVGGRRLGRLSVSTLTAHDFTVLVRRVTGLDAVVQRSGHTVSSTLPGVGERDFPRVGTLKVEGSEYRAATFQAVGFEGRPVRVSVLYGTNAVANDVADGRKLAGVILAVFLVLAVAFALLVSRSLQSEIGRFLAGAKRLGGGDFSTPVPTEGNDEFAQLGAEFNAMAAQLESRLEDLRRERARLQDSIRRVGETFASNLDRGALLEIVVRTAVDAVEAGAGRATVRAKPGAPLEQRAAAGEVGDFAEAIRAVEAEALESGEPAQTTADGRSALAHPFGAGEGEVLGLVSVARDGPAFTSDERELFHYLAGQASVSIENVDLHELVQRQAVTDDLTGLFNHRRFQEVVTAEVERSKRFEQPVGLVMLDIDDFKAVNDTYGHQQGDIVLREVGRALGDGSREIDEPARYGGEELAVALPQTDLEGAHLLAERVRVAIEALQIPRLDGQGVLRVTASFGVSSIPETAGEKEDLIASADAALYRAKHAGKNRTERAEPAAPAARKTARAIE